MASTTRLEAPGRQRRSEAARAGALRPLDWLLPAAITLAAAIFAALTLDIGVLENDDATSVFIAHLDTGRFWQALITSEANGSLFYLILRPWKALGTEVVTLRVLPAIFAIATVPLLYALTKRLFGVAHAVVASLVLSTNLLFLLYTRTVRSYSLAMFLATAATYLFIRNRERSTSGGWLLYAFVAALGTYAHFFTGLVVAAHVLTLILKRGDVDVRRFALGLGVYGVLVSPLAAFVAFQDAGQVDWIPALTPASLRYNLVELAGAGSSWGALVIASLAGIGIVGALVTAARSSDDLARWKLLMVLWCVVPVGVSIGMSLVKPMFVARYLLVALPPLAVLIALGALGGVVAWRVVALGALVAVAATALPQHFEPNVGGSWDQKAELVREEAGPNDALIFYSPTVLRPYGYYAGYYDAGETDGEGPPPIYPSRLWLGFSRTRFNPDYEAIAEDVRRHDRVWLLFGAAMDQPRRVEQAEMVEMLARTCSGPRTPYFRASVRLFTGCSESSSD